MNTQNLLSLRLVVLSAPGEWVSDGEAMSFVFPTDGHGSCECHGVVESLAAGDVLTTGARTKITAATDSQFTFRFFTLQAESLYPLLAAPELAMASAVIADFRSTHRFPAASLPAQKSHHLIEDTPAEENLEHRSQLLRAASVILTEAFARRKTTRFDLARPLDHVDQIFEQVSEDEFLTLPSDKLSAKFGFSPRHLNRLFHQRFGLSLGAMRMEMRLLKVLTLLRNPNEKIINVAEQCKFNHLGLFNTYFRRRFGCSPSEWRRQLNGREKAPVAQTISVDVDCRLRQSGLCPLENRCHPHPSANTSPPNHYARLVIRAYQ